MATDTKENKITVIGTADPIKIVGKVRKIWPSAYIISVGEEKSEEKKRLHPRLSRLIGLRLTQPSLLTPQLITIIIHINKITTQIACVISLEIHTQHFKMNCSRDIHD